MKRFLALCAVLIGLAAVFLLPACSSLKKTPDPAQVQLTIAESREQELDLVRQTVAETDRAERIIELLASRDRLFERYIEEIGVHRGRMTVLNAEYDTTRDAFDQQLAAYNQQRAAAQNEFMALVAAMKRETTAEEWKTIAKFQSKNLNPRQLTYGAAGKGD
jgi:predicted component of type VI protein secretion system